MKKLIPLTALALSVLTLAGCASSNPDVVSRSETQRLATVLDAVVLSTRPVVVDGAQSGMGAAAGGVVGGVAGSSVGGSREALAVGIIGAVVGGVIGNAVERNATREDALEILVQLRNGDRRSVVQAKGNENFTPGDPVILVTTGGRVRVSKAPVVTPQSPQQQPQPQPAAARPAPQS
jgi:outer membrane lipoprotein SlyB